MDVVEEMGEMSGVTTLPTRLLLVEEIMAAGVDEFSCRSMVRLRVGEGGVVCMYGLLCELAGHKVAISWQLGSNASVNHCQVML
jgi:hypothetical protein